MHVDGIVHHPLIYSVHRYDFAFALREMSGVGLCRKIARVIVPFQTDTETVHVDTVAKLCQQPHALCVVHLDIFQGGVRVMRQEDARSRAVPGTHGYHRTFGKSLVLPSGRIHQSLARLDATFGGAAYVAGIIYNVVTFRFKSDTRHRVQGPSVAVGLKDGVLGQAVFYPRSGAERDAFVAFILYNLYLGNVWVFKVDAEVFQRTVCAA